MPCEQPFDFEMLHLLATTCPDPATIDWRAEYARLYDDAEETEKSLRKELADQCAGPDKLAPPPDMAQSLLDCCKRLADLTNESVSTDIGTWHHRHSHETTVEYRVWLNYFATTFSGKTLDEAEAAARDAWTKSHPPLPVAEIVEPVVASKPAPAEQASDPPARLDF